MGTSGTDDAEVNGLPEQVSSRVVQELGANGPRVMRCLRTSATLLKLAVEDDQGLRLAESAAYNLREALDSVVAGRPPAAGGLPAILKAWDRYQDQWASSENDKVAALAGLEETLSRVAEKRDRNSYHTARLLTYLRSKAGVDPLSGEGDPAAEYSRLRSEASGSLHDDSELDVVTDLYDRVISWFIRIFTPPDEVVQSIKQLAAEPWLGDDDQIARLRAVATNPHQLRLFFTLVTDPAWLAPLYSAGVITPPELNLQWPAAGLLDGLGVSVPDEVAVLLERMLADSSSWPELDRAGARFELLRVAVHLGPAGDGVVADVARRHPTIHAVRALASGAARKAAPSGDVVMQVADALLEPNSTDHDFDYHARAVLDPFIEGTTSANIAARAQMLTGKLRRVLHRSPAGSSSIGIARLASPLGDEHDVVAVLSHGLARLLEKASELGVPTATLLEWAESVPDELGARLTCRALAHTPDSALESKIEHIALRVAESATATGDDYDLIRDVLATSSQAVELAGWVGAFEKPSTMPSDATRPPKDWMKAWRWSAVLPADLWSAEWQAAIAHVADIAGPAALEMLTKRPDPMPILYGTAAYTADELDALPALDAAAQVAAWRPDAESDARLVAARELARELEAAVARQPEKWIEDPTAIVSALREPVYVLHYLRALASKATEIAPWAAATLDAAQHARDSQSTPTVLGNDSFDYEPTWRNVDVAAANLAASLANNNAELASHLDTAWDWALDLIDTADPGDVEPTDSEIDALNHAINTAHGHGLQAVLALAAWEFRHQNAVGERFSETLDQVLTVAGRTGMDYRAILASRRPLLETIAPGWLKANGTNLFGDTQHGHDAIETTLNYSRPTRWFYKHFHAELVSAAKRGSDRAGAWLLDACATNAEYDHTALISDLAANTDALGSLLEHAALRVQGDDASPEDVGFSLTVWDALLDADRITVPPDALQSAGRWAMVKQVAADEWLPRMKRTLEATDGVVDFDLEVAEHASDEPPSETTLEVLILLLGHGDPWAQDFMAQATLKSLRAAADNRIAPRASRRLRTRLIELGHHQAEEILVSDAPDSGGPESY